MTARPSGEKKQEYGMEEEKERHVGRRRLLRGAGAVVVGAAGAGVASAVVATPAEASQGSAVLAGLANTESDTTSIQLTGATSPDAKAALRLTNASGPALTVDPINAANISTAPPAGSVYVDQFGDVSTIGDVGAGKYINSLYSPTWAAMPVPVAPVRWLDTRGIGVGTLNVVPGSGTIVGGKITPKGSNTASDLVVDFSSVLVENYVAVQVIVSVLGAPADGWLSLWGDGDWPGTISVNFLGGHVIGGFAHSELTGVFTDSTEPFGRLKIKITHAAAVTIDVVGFIAPDRFALFKPASAATFKAASTRTPKVTRRNSR
jgi:hypothetical protein